MEYKIICPYCFHEMKDTEVHFRSELVNQGDGDIIPDGYDDIEDFMQRYKGKDKELILDKYRDWDFFKEGPDEEYEKWWKTFGGTTEYNHADALFGVSAYHRTVINPNNAFHQRFLNKQPDGSYFIRDAQKMVYQIELKDGQKCYRRVCCKCHNPLPDGYGKNEVRFTCVIGITGSGKTVYMSQLLKRMMTYSAKVALSAAVTTPSVADFLGKNEINQNRPMPGSTPAEQFQQPLFFDMTREDRVSGGRITDTFVLYDVAGEIFNSPMLVNHFAPFIEHANGILLLVDPMQFEAIANQSVNGKVLDSPTKALTTIQNIISKGNNKEKISIPIAVCMSKADQPEVQAALNDELRERLLDDVHEVENNIGDSMAQFNAKEYIPIAKGLRKFVKGNSPELYILMRNNYLNFSYFAFTALGCEVSKDGFPMGPVLPRRVEEPLLWMFYKFNYIGKNEDLPWEVFCPNCGSDLLRELLEDERIEVRKEGFFRKRVEYHFNRICRKCDYKFEVNEE